VRRCGNLFRRCIVLLFLHTSRNSKLLLRSLIIHADITKCLITKEIIINNNHFKITCAFASNVATGGARAVDRTSSRNYSRMHRIKPTSFQRHSRNSSSTLVIQLLPILSDSQPSSMVTNTSEARRVFSRINRDRSRHTQG
jgi:hypothetical protein